MSLGKLLKAGKGLMGGQDGTRYQMHKHARLPKFGSSRNPFASEDRGEKSSAPPVVVTSEVSVPVPGPAPVSLRAPARPTAPLAAVTKAVRGLGAKWGKVNPFLRLPRRPGSARSAISRSGGTLPVQAELSLEKVQVMRNDLSDADVEIVPAVPAMAAGDSPPLLAAAGKSESGGNSWSRLTTRFFGAGTPT